MKKSLRCITAALVATVGLAVSPAVLATADPLEPTIPVIPTPQPLPEETVPDQGGVPAIPAPNVEPSVPAVQAPLPQVPPASVSTPSAQPEPKSPPVQQVPAPTEASPTPTSAAPRPTPTVPPQEPAIESPTSQMPSPPRESKPKGPKPSSAPEPAQEAPANTSSEPTTSAPESSEAPTAGDDDESGQTGTATTGPESPASSQNQPRQEQVVPDETPPGQQGLPGADSNDLTKPVELPMPEASKPIPEEILNRKPVEVTATAVDSIDSENRGQRDNHGPPVPGRDKVNHPWEHGGHESKPPQSADINIIGDDNTVTVVNQITNNYDIDFTNIQNRQDWMYLRNFDHPGVVYRVPTRYGIPVQLNPSWCNGYGGAWGFSATVSGSNFGATVAGGGVFYANNGCGYVPPPPRPRHYPPVAYVCAPVGYYGHPVVLNDYYVISDTQIYAPQYNTYLYGNWETRAVNQEQQRVFVPSGYAPEAVFQQQPIQGPPPFFGYSGLGDNPDPSATSVISDNHQRNILAGIAVLVVLLLGTSVAVAIYVRQKHDGA